MANIPAQLYRGDSDYLGTISNVDGQILFDSDKKEIFVDDGTTRESYGGGAGDKTYATLAQAQADIANISEKDTVFVKEGTSGSLTQRVDDLEDAVEQINTDLSGFDEYEVVYGDGSKNIGTLLNELANIIEWSKVTRNSCIIVGDTNVFRIEADSPASGSSPRVLLFSKLDINGVNLHYNHFYFTKTQSSMYSGNFNGIVDVTSSVVLSSGQSIKFYYR